MCFCGVSLMGFKVEKTGSPFIGQWLFGIESTCRFHELNVHRNRDSNQTLVSFITFFDFPKKDDVISCYIPSNRWWKPTNIGVDTWIVAPQKGCEGFRIITDFCMRKNRKPQKF